MFCLIKRIWFTNRGSNLFLKEVTWIPASENNLSDGTEVAGIDKYFCANTDKLGYVLQFAFYQIKGSLLSCTNNSSTWRYRSISFELFLDLTLDVFDDREKNENINDELSISCEVWTSSDGDKFWISFWTLLYTISRIL